MANVRKDTYTVLAQLVERVAFNHNVAGSTPAGGIFYTFVLQKYKKCIPLFVADEYGTFFLLVLQSKKIDLI